MGWLQYSWRRNDIPPKHIGCHALKCMETFLSDPCLHFPSCSDPPLHKQYRWFLDLVYLMVGRNPHQGRLLVPMLLLIEDFFSPVLCDPLLYGMRPADNVLWVSPGHDTT